MTKDGSDWKTYFDKWGPALLLFARQQTGYLTDAEDVVQEAFVKVWKKYGNHHKNTKSLLFSTVRTTAIDHRRSHDRRRIREHKLYEESGDATWFRRNLELAERNTLLEKALKQLSEDQQEVVVLKVWGELTFQEIAETLGISNNTAASRYRYALEHLKKQLTLSMT
ncbi:MAG: sigma-70 family RNA polymerase sigma factor [Verrucomicrobiae bacterium]|nr:sigma-70 family RNA polymerase sigma factor [Verrucomicrobiae bacterium]